MENIDINTLPDWHPIQNYFKEAEVISHILAEIDALQDLSDKQFVMSLINQLAEIEIRFQRKENQLFPYLEKHGWLGPSQGMWALHDQIRAMLKDLREQINNMNQIELQNNLNYTLQEIQRLLMIEKMRLFPNALQLLTTEDWQQMSLGETEIGFMSQTNSMTLSSNFEKANQEINSANRAQPRDQSLSQLFIELNEGRLLPEQLRYILQVIPFDLTFVDANDRVCFYNRGEDRVFPRSPAVIGREVKFCHPPKSVDTVLQILKAFKSGTKNEAEFWINFRERKIHIRYFAVRDLQKKYLGVIEVSQDITEIQKLNGERRLLEWT